MGDSDELQPPTKERIIDGIATDGGLHCETTALGVLLGHAGIDLSEAMLFGLGSGLSFIYWDSKQMELPFLGGRVKPFALTQNVTARLGLNLRARETSSAKMAWEHVRVSIDLNIPIGLQLDSHDLDYFGSRVHFAGHVVAMYGYDEQNAYLVDTAQQGGRVKTSLQSLAAARAARGPMSARHRSFTIEAPTSFIGPDLLVSGVISAITLCADEFLAPPISNLGNRGIRTAATRIRSLLDRVANPQRDLAVMGMLMERAGTGGALFRNLYRDFLTECGELLTGYPAEEAVLCGRDGFADSASRWTIVAELIGRAGATKDSQYLAEASEQLEDIAAIETAAMTTLRSL